MRILQIGTHDGNDHVLEYAKQYGAEQIILVEPNPNCIDAIKNNYKEFDTTIINVAIVTNDAQTVKLYIPSNDGTSQHNSTNKEHLYRHGHGHINEIEVLAININILLELHSGVDRLYIDTEGLDIDIINAIDFDRYKPSYLEFEYIHSDGPLSWGGPKLDQCVSKLENMGYQTIKSGYNIVAERL